jgi:hypothetical protein
MATTSVLTDRTRPRVLFIDRDGGSPQIAASLLRRLSEDRVLVDAAVTQPTGQADDQLLTSLVLHRADRVVVMSAGLDVARLPGPRYEEWDLGDDDLTSRVHALSDDLAAVGEPSPTMLTRLLTLLRAARRR